MFPVLRAGPRRVLLGLSATLGVFLIGYLIAPLISSLWEHWVSRHPSPIEIGFVQELSLHHGQALSLASGSRSRVGPATRLVSDTVILSHAQQVETLRDWLQVWGKSSVATPLKILPEHSAVFSTIAPSDDESRGGQQITGMVSAQEVLTLRGAEGDEFDVLFLQLMIRHHQVAISRARNASKFVRMPQIRTLVKEIVVQQGHELDQMNRLLALHGEQHLPLPLVEVPKFAMCKR